MNLTGIVISGNSHPKNLSAVVKGCQLLNIPYDIVDDPKKSSYNFVWIPNRHLEPSELSEKKIMFGPHFSVFPSHEMIGPIEEKYQNCYYNTLSEWNKELHKGLKIPLVCLPFGVDTKSFAPNEDKKDFVFVYCKGRHPSLLEAILPKLVNYKVQVITCGKYTEDWYKMVLAKSKFGIWLGSHESQGFALEEALSSDVPLLVVDAKSMKDEWHGDFIYKTDSPLKATSVPYWSKDCGELVTLETFDKGLEAIQNGIYHPRKFVTENLSIHKCLSRMLHHFGFTRNVVLVCSVIKTVTDPLSYTNTRSVFSQEERFLQKLETIRSVRAKIPNNYIVHLECSDLSYEYESVIRELVDEYINYNDNRVVSKAVKGPFKGLGESTTILEYIKGMNVMCENLWKISGRYVINGKFDLLKFKSGNCFKISSGMLSTVLYKIDGKAITEYVDALESCEEELKRGKGIEEVLTKKFTNVMTMDEIGVSGKVAVDGNELRDY